MKNQIKEASEEFIKLLMQAYPNIKKFETGEVLIASTEESIVCEIEYQIQKLLKEIK